MRGVEESKPRIDGGRVECARPARQIASERVWILQAHQLLHFSHLNKATHLAPITCVLCFFARYVFCATADTRYPASPCGPFVSFPNRSYAPTSKCTSNSFRYGLINAHPASPAATACSSQKTIVPSVLRPSDPKIAAARRPAEVEGILRQTRHEGMP